MINHVLMFILILILMINICNNQFKENLNNMTYLEILYRLVSHPNIKNKSNNKLKNFTK